jgi:large-conductance mechanosensitive channel
MLRNGDSITDYSMDADMAEDRIIVVEPVGAMATIDVSSMNNSIVQPLYYSTTSYGLSDIKDKFSTWWQNPVYKYTIIGAAVVLVILIIWLIYSMIKKRSMAMNGQRTLTY